MSEPPLHARLFRYKVTTAELAFLQAMVEHSRDGKGENVWASTPRLAAYAKLSERQAQRIIHSLLDRHVLRELAPANAKRRRIPATYTINEAALQEDTTVLQYLNREKQYALPGVERPAIPGEPTHPRTGDTMSPVPVTPCRVTGDTMSPNPLTNPLKDPTPKPPAAAFQDFIERQFQQAGYETQREVPVSDRGDGSGGRIDLVARRGEQVVAIECDDERPRRKSETKLLAFAAATQRLIVLREPAGGFREAPTLESQIRAPCMRCNGTGMRASYSTPRLSVRCECQDPN